MIEKNVYKEITTLKMKMIEKDVAKKQIVVFKRDRKCDSKDF